MTLRRPFQTMILRSASPRSAPFGDHSEDLCPRAMSHIVSTDKIPLDTVISYLCYRPVGNLILEAGDPIKRVSLFGVRGESAGERDASR